MAVTSRPRQCCCFLPAFYGVLAFSYIWILSGMINAITGWSQVHQLQIYPIPKSYEAALYFQALIFSSMTLVGIYGVIAAFLKRPSLVLGYLIMLGLHLLLNIAGGGYFLGMLFHARTDAQIIQCLQAAYNETSAQLCFTPITVSRNVAVSIYVVSWVLELYACFIIYSFLEDLKERAGNKDLENRSRTITPDIISQPTPVPNFKPATMSMGPGGYPISIIDGFGGMMPEAQGPGGVEQHTWDQVPLSKPHSNSPPTTPMVPSHPDYHTGMRPLRLAPRDGSASQPNSPHVIPPIEVSTSPIHPYGLGSAGLSTSYAFSAGNNSFGSRANTPTQAAYNTNSSGVDNRF